MIYIGIDPGKTGAMAILDLAANGWKRVDIIPFGEAEYNAALRQLPEGDFVFAAVERVAAMPHQGVTSTFSFGQNYGFILGLLTAYGIPFETVPPARWKRVLGVTSDKQTSIDTARRLYPATDLRRTQRSRKENDGMAEALLLATYAERVNGYIFTGGDGK